MSRNDGRGTIYRAHTDPGSAPKIWMRGVIFLNEQKFQVAAESKSKIIRHMNYQAQRMISHLKIIYVITTR
jgi:hypothetical protein